MAAQKVHDVKIADRPVAETRLDEIRTVVQWL